MADIPKISQTLPVPFVERCRPGLQQLLDAVDASWQSSAASWPPLVQLETEEAVAELIRLTGWSALFRDLGGASRAAHRELLPALLFATLSGRPISLSEWLRCLFGLEVVSSVLRSPIPFAEPPGSPTLSLVVSGPKVDPGQFRAVLRGLLPAHIAVVDDSIVWIDPSSQLTAVTEG
jgi:hypothetical protein